jgi:ketol-acid reductoisomerase
MMTPMTTIYYEDDADLGTLSAETVAVVGYGNQGRSWALNLREWLPAGGLRAQGRDTREGRR